MGKKSRKGWSIDAIIEMTGVFVAAFILSLLLDSFWGDDISRYLKIDRTLWGVILHGLLVAYVIGNLWSISRKQRKMKLAGVLESDFEKKLPSTPFKFFLDNLYHAKWGLVSCLFCIATLIPVIIFMKDVEVIKRGMWETTITSTGPSIVRVVFLLYLVDFFALAKSFKTMKDIYNDPFKRTYQEFTEHPLVLDSDSSRYSIVKELSSNVGVKTPKLFSTAAPVNPLFPKSFVLGETEEKAQIIFYKDYLDSLESEEFKVVIAHELWHVKMDIEMDFAQNVEPKYLFWYWIGQILLFTCGFFGIIALADATSSIAWPFRITEPYLGLPLFILANPVVFVFSAVPEIIGIFLMLSGIMVHPKLFKYTFVSWEQEEYFADSMAILTVKQARHLISALGKELFQLESKKPSKKFLENYLDSDRFSLDLKDYRRLLQPTYLKDRSVSLGNRIKQAQLVNKLLNDHINVSIKREVTDFSSFNLFGWDFRLYFSPFARALSKADKHVSKKVYEYLQSNAEEFNIVECANSSGITLTDAFGVFACFVMAGVIE